MIKKEEYVTVERFDKLREIVRDLIKQCANVNNQTEEEIVDLKNQVAMLTQSVATLECPPVAAKGGGARVVIKKGRNTVNIVTR
jgi:cell division septum initiation protein DivIVA